MAAPGLDLAEAYELAVATSPAGVLIVDADDRIVRVNHAVERVFRYRSDELVGRHLGVLLPDVAGAIRDARSERSGDTPGSLPTDSTRRIVGRRQDGAPCTVDLGVNPVDTANGRFVVVSVMEVAEQPPAGDAQRAASEEQHALDRLIIDLSSQFINLPADQIDDAVRNGLRQACELLRLDRATFVRIGPDGALLPPFTWNAPNVSPIDPSTTVRERFPWTFDRLLAGEVVCFATRDEIPSEVDRGGFEGLGTQSSVAVPLSVDGHVTAVVVFSTVRAPRTWPAELVNRLTVIATVFAQVVTRQDRDQALHAAMDEAQRLKNQLQMENVYLRQEARARLGPTEMLGQSPAFRHLLEQIQQVAGTDSTVLLLGETGTGKELLATHMHTLGPRRNRPMVRVNCAAIPATLIESELFGREKGAFTGALSRQAGRFELADHSTIFLDEIGDLPLEIQVKLLRVLEERTFERLGSSRPIAVDTRIIAATHRNVEQLVAEGTFREDLYYRLNVFPIHVPPLRERAEDIPLLVWRMVEEFSRAFGKRIDVIDKDSLTAMQRYSWPGNIRELRNVVERAMIVATGRRLTIPLPHTSSSAAAKRGPKLIDVEKEHIRAVLESAAWRIRGVGGAADRLGMKPTTLETRMAKLGLKRPGHS